MPGTAYSIARPVNTVRLTSRYCAVCRSSDTITPSSGVLAPFACVEPFDVAAAPSIHNVGFIHCCDNVIDAIAVLSSRSKTTSSPDLRSFVPSVSVGSSDVRIRVGKSSCSPADVVRALTPNGP